MILRCGFEYDDFAEINEHLRANFPSARFIGVELKSSANWWDVKRDDLVLRCDGLNSLGSIMWAFHAMNRWFDRIQADERKNPGEPGLK